VAKTNGKAAAEAAAYVRVSSASQSAAMQRDAIERAARTRGDVVSRWYDDRFTGGGRHPPALVDLLSDARQGHVRRLYVYRLDRLSRRGIRDLLALVHDLETCGVEIVTLADGFELAGAARDVILAVLAWAAQMERQAINERIAAARVRVEANGGAWGRPKRMQPFQVRRARELAAEGKSMRAIARALKLPRATVWRAVSKSKAKPGLKKAAVRAP
jgi:DNA invertase Pin-like site-specific DNA recombinase